MQVRYVALRLGRDVRPVSLAEPLLHQVVAGRVVAARHGVVRAAVRRVVHVVQTGGYQRTRRRFVVRSYGL